MKPATAPQSELEIAMATVPAERQELFIERYCIALYDGKLSEDDAIEVAWEETRDRSSAAMKQTSLF